MTHTDRIAALDEEDQEALRETIETLIQTLESGTGAAVLLADVKGDGRASMAALGNALLTAPLLLCAGTVHDNLFERHEGFLQ